MPTSWTEPLSSRSRVNRAGRALAEAGTFDLSNLDDFIVVTNWRSSHGFPLNSIQMGLRQHCARVDSSALVSQRLKRFPSIIAKLRSRPTMQLARMQDIGGCRAVLRSVPQVYRMLDRYRRSRSRSDLHRITDYVAAPKRSGYRSVHLVYKFNTASAHRQVYSGHFIEIQLRTQLQHVWATAVETVDALHHFDLKGGRGPADWLDFFSSVSSAFALKEGTEPVDGTPSDPEELRQRVGDLAGRLNVRHRLRSYGIAVRHIHRRQRSPDSFYIIDLSRATNLVRVRRFPRSAMSEAAEQYAMLEREAADEEGRDVVLASANSITDLRRAYPNYFADTGRFLEELEQFLALGR